MDVGLDENRAFGRIKPQSEIVKRRVPDVLPEVLGFVGDGDGMQVNDKK